MKLVELELIPAGPFNGMGERARVAEPLVSFSAPGSLEADQYRTLRHAVERLREKARCFYDYVLIDTPPVVAVADSRLLEQWVDCFIVVVAAHKTPRKLLSEALNLLDPAKVLGVVFNGDDRPLAPYYVYYHPAPARPPARDASWWRRALRLFS